jgi:putative FmdB family regulatory protein
MPTYDYACGRCGGFDALRRVSQRDERASSRRRRAWR